jgi:hypothetical protein
MSFEELGVAIVRGMQRKRRIGDNRTEMFRFYVQE